MPGYTIRTMAERCGMTAHTLRYYERVGLIEAVERAHNGHRRYTEADEGWIKFLQSLRATHMPIREIQRFAALRESGVAGVYEQRKILDEHRKALEEQITSLKEALVLLTAHIGSMATEIQILNPSAAPSSQRASQEVYVRQGKLLDVEARRRNGFTSRTKETI